MKFDMDEFAKEVAEVIDSKEPKATGFMTEEDCEKVLQEIAKEKKINVNKAMGLVAGLMQNGGSNRTAGTLISYQLGGVSLNAQKFGSLLNKVKKGTTPRQFCRAMRDMIYECASVMGEEGDFARQMRMAEPMMTREYSIWCSNFQTGNPRCPERVRTWLAENYNKRFRK